MRDLIMKKGENALVIVAHPDDEVIWMGGMLLLNRQVSWNILVLCRASDSDREPKFRKVCRHLGAKGMILDLEDEGIMGIEESAKAIKEMIRKNAAGLRFDYLFTHGAAGEYGHPRHIGVNRAVCDSVSEGTLQAGGVLFFNYAFPSVRAHPLAVPGKNSDFTLDLDEKVWQEKRRIVAEMYGYRYDSPDVGYCSKTEAFKIMRKRS